MKVLNPRRKLVALVPLVAIAILSIGNRTGAVPDQNQEIREAANEVGIVVQGGITHGETLRFSAFHLAEASCETHEQMLLTVFESQGNVVMQQTWTTNPNQTFYFDLNGDQLPQSSFDNNGRAQLVGLLTHSGRGELVAESPAADAWSPEQVFDNSTSPETFDSHRRCTDIELSAGAWIRRRRRIDIAQRTGLFCYAPGVADHLRA